MIGGENLSLYSEYFYENRKYEFFIREIQSALFKIVATEEGNIDKLREKAFTDTDDPKVAAELQNLYVQWDGCLRSLIAVSDELTKAVQRLDTCSRKQAQIEDKNIAQIIAHVRDMNESQQLMPVQVQPTELNPNASIESNEVSYENPAMQGNGAEYSGAADVAMAPEPVDEPVMVDPGTTIVEIPTGSTDPVVTDMPTETSVEVPMDNTDPPVIVETSEVGVTENPAVSDVNIPAIDVGDSSMGEALVSEPAEVAIPSPVVAETVSDPVSDNPETMDTTLTIPTVGASSEGSVTPLIIPTGDMTASTEPIVETTTTDVISTDAPVAEVPATDSSTDLGSIPVITISSDGPLEAVSTPLIVPTDGTTEAGLADIVPVTASSSDMETMIVFKKRNNDPPKVIMVSKEQAAKLNQSLSTQEALISAKGYFGSTTSNQSLEQQLMDSGLLTPDVTTKQAQIEQMMTQANELYAAGKVEEAQSMYNKISALNKELQESVGISK